MNIHHEAILNIVIMLVAVAVTIVAVDPIV